MALAIDAAKVLHAIRKHKAYCSNTYAHAAAKGLGIAEKIVMEALAGEPILPGGTELLSWEATRESFGDPYPCEIIYVMCPYCGTENWIKDHEPVWSFCPFCGERVFGGKSPDMTFGKLADALYREEEG